VKQRNRCPNRPLRQQLILKGNAHELTVKGKAEGSEVHIQENSEDPLLLEKLAVRFSEGVVGVPELAEAVISKSKFVVRKTGVDVEGLLGCDSNLELVLGARVCDDLPVVDSSEEWAVGGDGPEVVVGLVQERMAAVRREGDLFA